MGFKSVMKKVGKVALKVAPYAAMAIPGVGVPLGMALAGGLNAANKKISGGSWKDALISGGVGAGLSAVGGKIPGVGKVLDKIPGLGPSNAGSFVKDAVSNTANKVSGGGIKSILGQVGKGALSGAVGGSSSGTAGNIGNAVGNEVRNSIFSRGQGARQPSGGSMPTNDSYNGLGQAMGPVMPQGGYDYNQNPMNQLDQSRPNLSQSIFQGRQEALNDLKRRQQPQVAY